MIGEDIKTEVSLEELRKITWDYCKEEIIGLYHNEVVRGFMWQAKECGDVNPFLVDMCNVVEGWVRYYDADVSDVPEGSDLPTTMKRMKLKRDENDEIVRIEVPCKVVVDLFDAKGNVIVTLR